MISDKSFNINLNPSKLFASDYPIKSKAYCRVFIDSIGEGTWSVIADTAYDVINDTVVFATIPTGKYLVIQVATTPAELTQTPTESTAILTIKNEIKTVSSNASSVITVSDNIESIKSVKTNLADVTVVKNNIGNVNIVADNIDNVNTVALNTTNINLVKNNTTNINTVAGNNSNISVVSNNISNVNTVAGNNTNINIVKDNVSNMATVVNNITAIQNAQANSSVVITKAQEASESATIASNSVTKAYQWAENPLNVEVEGGKYSAKHWANKAMEFSGFGDFMALLYTKVESDSRFVHLEGSENINGTKNFTGKVQVVTPTDNTDAVNKGYVDSKVGTKLDTASFTGTTIIDAIKTVDGAGSGLDADLLDGQQATAFAPASHTHAYVASRDRMVWNDGSVIGNVVGQLGWKNFGNGHTIFDASAGTSPTGEAINNSIPQHAWVGSHPTLMGFNGVNTFGVRVDNARTVGTVSAGTPSGGVHGDIWFQY